MVYQSPNLVEYGLSKDLVKGQCGWGGDSILFNNKTETRWYILDCDDNGICYWTQTTVCAEKRPPMPCYLADGSNTCY